MPLTWNESIVNATKPGQQCEADPSLADFYKRLDPCNCFNPGIGKTSKFAAFATTKRKRTCRLVRLTHAPLRERGTSRRCGLCGLCGGPYNGPLC